MEIIDSGKRKKIGEGQPAFIVAEISGNHHQNFEEAVALVKAAKKSGADAVKLQTYTPDTITLNSDKKWFRVGGIDNPSSWKGKTLYKLYSEAYTPWEWQPKLKKLADDLDIILFSTPFDESSVDFLESLKVPCYKISSYESTDFILLRKVAKTNKPVIVSVGYSTFKEVKATVDTLRENGVAGLSLLYCVTGYAKRARGKIRLSTICDLKNKFNVIPGFSDNNAGIDMPIFAVASGAKIIEKHLILDRRLKGPDSDFSLEPSEFCEMVKKIREFESGKINISIPKSFVGRPYYGSHSRIERHNMMWRRSLFSSKEIKKGEIITGDNIKDVRPAHGLDTRYFDKILGKRARRNIPFATPLTLDMIEI